MKAMILAAGIGSRLKPLTDHMPKALVPVKGTPMLQHVIEKLKREGFNDLVINVHHFANQITEFLRANDNFGLKIQISDETAGLLDTGGALQHALPLFGNDEFVLIHNTDILSNCNLAQLCEFHLQHAHQAVATLLVSERQTTRYLLFDDQNCLRGWINKATGKVKPEGFVYTPGKYHEYAYSCIQIVNTAMLKQMPEGAFSIIDYYLSICNEQNILCYTMPDLQILDIGKPNTLAQADSFIQNI